MEDRPKSLKDEAERTSRLQLLRQRHMRPLTHFVEQIRREQPGKEVPYLDPLDGGMCAQCLFVLQAPGRMTRKGKGSGFVSRNNNDETAKNFFEANKKAGIPRRKTLTWNIVPWYIGNGGRRRTPDKSDIGAGLQYLYRLIEMLPCLRVVMLLGKKAQSVQDNLRAKCPDVEILECYLPSPLFVNNEPSNRQKIVEALTQVRKFLDDLP